MPSPREAPPQPRSPHGRSPSASPQLPGRTCRGPTQSRLSLPRDGCAAVAALPPRVRAAVSSARPPAEEPLAGVSPEGKAAGRDALRRVCSLRERDAGVTQETLRQRGQPREPQNHRIKESITLGNTSGSSCATRGSHCHVNQTMALSATSSLSLNTSRERNFNPCWAARSDV